MDLYQELILDHNKHPHNWGELSDSTKSAQGYNPTCGDKYLVQIKSDEDGMIANIKFIGQGCAISKASASMMTDAVQGKSIEEAKNLVKDFTNMLKHQDHHPLPQQLQLFEGVKQYPSRIKCANLAWHALAEALED